MFQVIFLVDATEPINLVIGPLFFLYIVAKIDEDRLKKVFYHFIPALFYFFYTILFHIQSIEDKYNSYIDQYHPDLSYVPVPGESFSDPLFLKSVINELTILSIFVYVSVTAIFLWRAQKRDGDKKRAKLYNMLWVDIGFMTFLVALIIFVKAYFEHDLGDYIIITVICIFIYATSFKIIRDSVFFKAGSTTKKYSKSTIDENLKEVILNKINELMEDKYYLNVNPSLPDLAKKINTSPNYVSQVINEKLNLTFLEMINKYRIEEAKKMILDPELNETVEGIAYLVGFNSKSTFHSAFKRITGETPSEFKNSNNL